MKPDKILQSDWLDILFDNRNKMYGAYPLRKYKDKRTMLALSLVFIAVVVFVGFSTFWKQAEGITKIVFDGPMLQKIYTVPYEIPEQPKTEVKPLVQAKKIQTANSGIIKLVDEKLISAPVPDIASNSTRGLPTTGISDISLPGELPIPGTIPNMPDLPQTNSTTNNSQPLFTAEQMPEYPGGIAALRKFLKNNLQSPDVDLSENIIVKIRFVVGFDGHLKGFEIVENGGEAFNNEVIRVLKKMPQWIPGKSQGQNVSVYFTLPVIFAANNL